MPCVEPKTMYGETIPCGSCIGCRRETSREWRFRLIHELERLKCEGVFLTLTYNDENLPKSLNKKTLQDFIKRIRKEVKKEIKYFAVGEYGEQFKRPHYHIIILGLGRDSEIFTPIPGTKYHRCTKWENGFVHVGTLTPQSINYVTGYLTKQSPFTSEQRKDGTIQQPFRLMSKGIGKEYVQSNMDELTQTLSLTSKGVQYKLPRYYRKEMLKIDPNVQHLFDEKAIAVQREQRVTLIETTHSGERRVHEAYVKKENEQKKKNLEQQEYLHKTKNF